MRRADRLFQIIQLMRGRRRAVTARQIAEHLEVSERTIYRDIRDLVASGTPIEGEAGIGYSLRRAYDLPPLMFDADEVEALMLGARLVAAYGDANLRRAAASVVSKVEVVLPAQMKARLAESSLFVANIDRGTNEDLLAIRVAIQSRQKLRIRYEDREGEGTERVIRPLGAFFWGRRWTVTAWCELRQDVRNFRLDRIAEVEPTGDTFEEEPSATLREYLVKHGYASEDELLNR